MSPIFRDKSVQDHYDSKIRKKFHKYLSKISSHFQYIHELKQNFKTRILFLKMNIILNSFNGKLNLLRTVFLARVKTRACCKSDS